ncbi:MAG: HEAT repeat domain-containing protein [Planctomycetota bacterium]
MWICLTLAAWLFGALAPHPCPAGDPDPAATFQEWFRSYKQRRIVLLPPLTPGGPRASFLPTAEQRAMEETFLGLESLDNLASARLLMEAATFSFSPPDQELERDALQQPWLVRQRASLALGRLHSQEAREWIRAQLLAERNGSSGPQRRVAAAMAIGHHGDPAGVFYLSHALRDNSAEVRVSAAMGLGQIRSPAALPALTQALGDEVGAVRVACLGALAEVLEAAAPAVGGDRLEETLGAAARLLEDDSWPVRLEAVGLLRRFRLSSHIPRLIEALAHEQPGARDDYRGRVRSAIQEALRSLTGAYRPEDQPNEWRRWWADAASTFQLPPPPDAAAAQTRYGTFFNLAVNSTRVLFVIDVSGSMLEPLGQGVTGVPSKTKWQSAFDELERTLGQLDADTCFGVICFADRVVSGASKLRPATEEAKRAALALLRGHPPRGGTNLFGALALGLGLSSVGSTPVTGSAQVDTVFVLSDGLPTVGSIVAPDAILAAIGRANSVLRVRINAVSFGTESSYLLQELARRNGGDHVHVVR